LAAEVIGSLWLSGHMQVASQLAVGLSITSRFYGLQMRMWMRIIFNVIFGCEAWLTVKLLHCGRLNGCLTFFERWPMFAVN